MICTIMFFLLKCNKNIQDFFQRSQNTELTAVKLTPKEEEEEEVLRLQEEITSSRTSQNREGNHSQCCTRTRSRSPSEVGTRSSDVSRSATGNLAGLCPAIASAEAAAHPTLEHTGESSKATRVSAVSVKTKATGATEPASAPKVEAKTLMTETPSLTVAMTPTGDDVKWRRHGRHQQQVHHTMISCSTQKKEADKMKIEEHQPKPTKFGSWREKFLKRSIEFIMLSQRSNGVDWRSGDCEKFG